METFVNNLECGNMEIEYQSGNHWISVSEERTEEFIERATTYNNTTPEAIIGLLKLGEPVRIGQGWDDEIRDAEFARKKEEQIEKMMEERATKHETKDYLATHDNDWYEEFL